MGEDKLERQNTELQQEPYEEVKVSREVVKNTPPVKKHGIDYDILDGGELEDQIIIT